MTRAVSPCTSGPLSGFASGPRSPRAKHAPPGRPGLAGIAQPEPVRLRASRSSPSARHCTPTLFRRPPRAPGGAVSAPRGHSAGFLREPVSPPPVSDFPVRSALLRRGEELTGERWPGATRRGGRWYTGPSLATRSRRLRALVDEHTARRPSSPVSLQWSAPARREPRLVYELVVGSCEPGSSPSTGDSQRAGWDPRPGALMSARGCHRRHSGGAGAEPAHICRAEAVTAQPPGVAAPAERPGASSR